MALAIAIVSVGLFALALARIRRGREARQAAAATVKLEVDRWGVKRWLADGRYEEVSWDELREVRVITLPKGPWDDRLRFVLDGGGERGCIVPLEVAEDSDLLASLGAAPASTTGRWPRPSRAPAPATRCCGRGLQLDRPVKVASVRVSALDTAPASAASTEQRVNELIDQLLAEHDPKSTSAVEFLGAQFDLGLAWVHFPEGHGGIGASPKLQKVVNERLAAVGAPTPYGRNPIGYGMGAPTVVTHGSDEQRRATSGRSSPAKRCGARCSASRVPAAMSRVCRRERFATATSGSSTVRRCGPPSRTLARWGCSSPAPTPSR